MPVAEVNGAALRVRGGTTADTVPTDGTTPKVPVGVGKGTSE